MSRIYAIDASLTSTGIAVVDGDTIRVGSITSTGKRSDTIVDRDTRLTDIADRAVRWWPSLLDATAMPADLIVIEGPSFGSRGSGTWDRAGLWWRIVTALPVKKVAVVAPATRAKWATNHGGADKAAVASAVSRLCPDIELANSDQADALALALMGAHALGERPDLDTKYRREALLKAQWPANVAARLLEPYERPVEQEALT